MADAHAGGGQQMRFTDEELELLRSMFKDNEKGLKLLRKIFLPELDPNAPLGQMVDLWLVMSPSELTPEDAYVNIKARNSVIAHLEQQLLQIQYLASLTDPDPVVKAKAKAQDSNQ